MLITFSKLGKYGRLGNSMFQVAATLAAAQDQNKKALFPTWSYAKYFQGLIPQHSNYFIQFPPMFTYNEPRFTYDKIPMLTVNTDLRGYFQSEKYFAKHSGMIRRLFKPTDDIALKLKKEYKGLNFKNMVAVHVRRTDYLELADYHPVCEKEYYADAAHAMIKENPNVSFLVFSDDKEYCKKLFGELVGWYVIEGNSDIDDLFLMARCRYHIIANSSFSWWGSYLAKSRLTIAPKKWFGPSGPSSTADLIPENWLQI